MTGDALAVLNVSLDAQIAWEPGRAALGDPAERQRRYAERLRTLHVIVKTGRDATRERVPLAPNAWAYPTHSATRYAFIPDALRIGTRLLHRERIDVISAQDPFATGLVCALLAWRFRKPLNVQVHFDVLDNPHWIAERREHRALNVLGKWLVRRADTLRVGTTREAATFASWGISRERIFVAPVPVDLAAFTSAADTSAGRQLILNASRLVPQKDLPTLLRACRQVTGSVPGAEVAIAGDGPLRGELERLAAELGMGEKVRFLGRVDRHAMPALIASASVLAVSSVYEGTSLVTVQAAAAGKPVVTTDVAGTADTVVHGETGYVVPVGDADAFAHALVETLSDPERARRMGERGRAHVSERFDLDRSVGRVVEMWTATAALRMASESGEWLYLANVRVPSEKAHVYQIFQMLDAFADTGIGVHVRLAYPRRKNLAHLDAADPKWLYALRHTPAVVEVGTVDAIKRVTIDWPALNRAPFPQLAFALQSATFAASATRLVAQRRPRLVYSRDWLVLAAVAVTGVPLFWEAHDLPQGRAARRALRALLPRLAGIVAITEGLRRELLALGVPAVRVIVAPDAVDLTRFESMPERAEARARLGLDAGRRYAVYTGHLYAWKGAHTLARATQSLPADTEALIVGGTPGDLRAFRRFVSDERLDRVRIAGHRPPAEVPLWLASADVLVLPNSAADAISSRYTSPLKLFEYMAAQRPIVASDLPSLREVLRHGENAWLVPPDSPEALAAGIASVLADPAPAQRLAARAREDVAECTWTARARAIVRFADAVLPC